MDDIEEPVIIDHRHQKHENEANRQKSELLVIEAVKLGVNGSGFDFKNGDDRKHKDKAEENPVEIAERRETAHVLTLL
jgi:hypothetical protein